MAHRPGTFGWIDLSTTDVGTAKAFYTGLLGWEMTDVPTDIGVDYTMCTKDGKQVAGWDCSRPSSPRPVSRRCGTPTSSWTAPTMQ